MIRIKVTGNEWWERRVYYLSHGGLGKLGTLPALKELDRAFRQTLTMLFKPGGGGGVRYEHGYTGKYLTGLHSVVTPNSLKIIEGTPTGGKEIRESGPPGNYPDIVKWARKKLRVSQGSAERIANTLEARGYVGGGTSPMRSEHPGGEPKFAYPEWIVEIKNAKDIDKASRTVESLIVRYLR